MWLGNELSNLIYKDKYEKKENPNKRKDADKRKQCGEEDGWKRNVGHPEEHSRVPKGPKVPVGRER